MPYRFLYFCVRSTNKKRIRRDEDESYITPHLAWRSSHLPMAIPEEKQCADSGFLQMGFYATGTVFRSTIKPAVRRHAI